MPELPEVETVRRALQQTIVGKTIGYTEVFYPGIIRYPNENVFKLLVGGQLIRDIGRKGKYLLIYMESATLVSHLRMEGKYVYSEDGNIPYDKHTHVVFNFTDGSKLLYNDVRKFGTMDCVARGNEKRQIEGFNKLGPEPIDPDFPVDSFIEQVQAKKLPIKQILLNQEIISGLGNIYVDECLAISKLHPLRPGSSLTEEEIKGLVKVIKELLLKAIELGGSSIKTFESAYGKGTMQEHLIVYGKAGKPCTYCGTPIERIKVAGRGTHICPNCQQE